MQNKKIRVLIADDHVIFRTGLKNMLAAMKHIQLVGEAENGLELVAAALKYLPDVMLVDLSMPVMDGIVATRELCKRIPWCRVIALTVFGQENRVTEMLAAGARGFLLKNADKRDIEAAIVTVMQGRPFFCKEITDEYISKYESGEINYPVSFSKREREIIQLICDEYTSPQIASTLFLSKRTVEGHRTRIMKKMDVESLAGLIKYAVEKGLDRLS